MADEQGCGPILGRHGARKSTLLHAFHRSMKELSAVVDRQSQRLKREGVPGPMHRYMSQWGRVCEGESVCEVGGVGEGVSDSIQGLRVVWYR